MIGYIGAQIVGIYVYKEWGVRMKEVNHKKQMYAYWLNSLPGIGSKTIRRLMSIYEDPEAFYQRMKTAGKCVPSEAGTEGSKILTLKQETVIKEHIKQWDVSGEYDKLLKADIRFLTMDDVEYPKHLKEIPDPPFGIFVKGRIPSDKLISVAVVGARECSEYGKYMAKELGNTLGSRGIQVISGMARGIDGISQMAALEAGGTSFGVLGCGVDICYPAGNQALYRRLIKEGGILASYPPGTQPQASLFPPRNRIVSGLADVVVVVEARQKSGTLITVDMALEQGREVYCVPGRLTDRLSDGCNKLIRQGAGIVLSPEDLLDELANLYPDRAYWSLKKAKKVDNSNNDMIMEQLGEGMEARILEQLDFTPKSIEQIRAGIIPAPSYAETQQILMRLTLASVAGQASPGYFVKKYLYEKLDC